MGPDLGGLSLFIGTLRDEQIGRSAQRHGVFAVACVRAIGDDTAIDCETVPQRERGVAEGQRLQGEGEGGGLFRHFHDPCGVGKIGKGDRKGLVEEGPQDVTAPGGTAEDKPFFKPEFRQDMQSLDMVHVEVAEE